MKNDEDEFVSIVRTDTCMTVYSGANTGTYFYCYDGNGNVMALVNASNGAIAAQYEYGPFGEVIRATGPMAKLNPFRFSTKYDDDETDFLYYGYRYYNPSTGRWPSRDPLTEPSFIALYGQPLWRYANVNLYGFIGNRSLNYVDVLGLCCTPSGCVKNGACESMVVPNGSTPDIAKGLPDLVELADETDKFGLIFDSGMTGGGSLLSLEEGVAEGVGGAVNTVSNFWSGGHGPSSSKSLPS